MVCDPQGIGESQVASGSPVTLPAEFNRLTGSEMTPDASSQALGIKVQITHQKWPEKALCTAKEHPEGTKCLS